MRRVVWAKYASHNQVTTATAVTPAKAGVQNALKASYLTSKSELSIKRAEDRRPHWIPAPAHVRRFNGFFDWHQGFGGLFSSFRHALGRNPGPRHRKVFVWLDSGRKIAGMTCRCSPLLNRLQMQTVKLTPMGSRRNLERGISDTHLCGCVLGVMFQNDMPCQCVISSLAGNLANVSATAQDSSLCSE